MARRPRKESMMCRNADCDKPHEFLQYEGRYYCLECFDQLSTSQAKEDKLYDKIAEVQESASS